MIVLKQLGDWILSLWIWQITADWFHPIITAIVMFFLLRIIMRRSRFRSFIISVGSQLAALGLLTLIAIGGLVHIFGWEFTPIDPYEGVKQITLLRPTLGLGIFYALLQSIIFIIGAFFWEINAVGYITLSWLSNAIGAMLSYMFISMVEIMKYQG